MDLLPGKHEQHIIKQPTNMKIDKGMSVGKICGVIEGYVSGAVVATGLLYLVSGLYKVSVVLVLVAGECLIFSGPIQNV